MFLCSTTVDDVCVTALGLHQCVNVFCNTIIRACWQEVLLQALLLSFGLFNTALMLLRCLHVVAPAFMV